MTQPGITQQLEIYIQRLRNGDDSAREPLISIAEKRLRYMASFMLHKDPAVHRWEQTDDVLQCSLTKLHNALSDVKPESVRAFFGLASLQIRRVLLDMWRHHNGPQGFGKNHGSVAALNRSEGKGPPLEELMPDKNHGPQTKAEHKDIHQYVDKLRKDLREVVNLLFYAGLQQEEVAGIMNISTRTVKRKWREARLSLYNKLFGDNGDAF